MKKEWTYTSLEQPHICRLDDAGGTLHLQGPQYRQDIQMADWLTTVVYRLPMKIEVEVTRSVVACIDPSTLSESQHRHYMFWAHLDTTQLPPSSRYHPISRQPHWKDLYLELTPLGVQYVQTTHSGSRRVQAARRLDQLFFQGPSKPLSLNSRVEIRHRLLAALARESGLTIADAFPLFDYSKIPLRHYEHSVDDNDSGTYWALEGTHITVGGWSRQGRDGGASQLSIEAAWRTLSGLSGPFEQHRAEIQALLEEAIIPD